MKGRCWSVSIPFLWLLGAPACADLGADGDGVAGDDPPRLELAGIDTDMSPAGELARRAREQIRSALRRAGGPGPEGPGVPPDDVGDLELPGGSQGELSIATDPTGRHVVIGFNDFRGFDLEVTSVSGFMWSDDFGRTWERLLGPTVAIPADAQYVEVEFDVCYDTEDDPSFNVLAYDGFFLRVFDATTGAFPRSNLVEAFASDFTTDGFFHYPKHFPRNSDPLYFEDMSAWAGDSGGVQHVRMRLEGMAGTSAQLRFEFAQDSLATCADVRPGSTCGVLVDNVVVNSVTSR